MDKESGSVEGDGRPGAFALSDKERHRKRKDPNAPVRPRSAYLFFLLDKNVEIRTQEGFDSKSKGSVADVTKLVGEAWQKLTPEEKLVR